MKYPTKKRRILAAFLKWSIAAIFYFIAPHLTLIQPIEVQPTSLDQWVPYLSWSLVIYLTLYFQVMFCLLATTNVIMLNQMLKCYIWLTIILSCFYIAIPIRSAATLPDRVGDPFHWLLLHLREVDIASNSLPSGHVTYSLAGPVFLFAYGEEKYKYLPWGVLLWGILLSLSTLTTKQHVIGDLLCGAVLGISFGWLSGAYAREQVLRRLKGKGLRRRRPWRLRRLWRRI